MEAFYRASSAGSGGDSFRRCAHAPISSCYVGSCLGLVRARKLANRDGEGSDNKVRIATLAPRDSDLVRGFLKVNNGLKKATNGEWSLQLYPGGMAGDEKDFIRKMRVNQLDGAAVTAVGLSQIARDLTVLNAPGAIETYERPRARAEDVQQRVGAEARRRRPEGAGLGRDRHAALLQQDAGHAAERLQAHAPVGVAREPRDQGDVGRDRLHRRAARRARGLRRHCRPA